MKILVAEDDTGTRLVLVATLRKLGHEVIAVSNGLKAWEAWQQDDYALLLSDWLMPGLDGLELCRRIRADPRVRYTYIVLLTALGGKSRYIDGIDAGADDLITKPFDEDMLDARLRVAERILGLHEALLHQAAHDRLTGLWNHGAILDSLQQDMDRSAREGSPLGVMMADLDHFKRVNDNHGHPTGDEVLKEAARRMKVALRAYDRIGRYGGEEFLIVAPGAGHEQTLAVAQRICSGIGGMPMATRAGPLAVTVSVGAAFTEGRSPTSPAALIARADAALYRAKMAGRNRIEMADSLEPPG